MSAECRTCGASIIWCVTDKNQRMPVDAEPAENGNLLISLEGGQYFVTAGRSEHSDGEPLYTSHFATCVNAAQHRKAKR